MPTMRHLYQSGRLSQYLLWLACGAGVVGLLAARSLVALSPVAGVAAALLNPDLPHAWRYYVRNGAALRAAALYLFVLISGLYTANLPDWRHEIFRQLPWLGVPLAFTVAVPLRQGQRVAVGALFVLGTAAVGLATLAQFMGRTAAITEAIRLGQNVPVITRVFHIHFGVMLALAFFGAWSCSAVRWCGLGCGRRCWGPWQPLCWCSTCWPTAPACWRSTRGC